jgi:hypothetical protein
MHEELAKLQAGEKRAATEFGDVVLVPMTDALDEPMDGQVFELSRDLAGGTAG